MSTFVNIYSAMNSANIITGKKTEPEKKAKLKMNNQEIHSLQELKDNFNAEVILKKFKNGKLLKWLEQHYYEAEAKAVTTIDTSSKKLLEELCNALGISYSPIDYMSEDDKEKFLTKKETLESVINDADILAHAHLVAMNQDELASLIDRGETTIYLCNNSFNIPIAIDNKKYIGIGKVIIENAFTKQQYEKAGILIENITLPEAEDPDTIDVAKSAAKKHGYDDFADNHSILATSYHEALRTEPFVIYHHLPFDSSILGNMYTSRSACYNTAESVITKAYTAANEYFNTESKKSLSKECAKYYSNVITSVFKKKMPELEKMCKNAEKTDCYEKLCKLISKAKTKLKKAYNRELIENAEFYKMYNLDYFIEQVDIEKFDNSVSDDDDLLGQFLEAIFSGTKEYMITDLYSPISEMEFDLEDHATTFYKFAHREYMKYVGKIEGLLEKVGSTIN